MREEERRQGELKELKGKKKKFNNEKSGEEERDKEDKEKRNREEEEEEETLKINTKGRKNGRKETKN